jgi:acetyltransferase
MGNLLSGYRGALYPVNQNYSDIQGVPCYPSVESIPGPVDLAIIIIPAPAVPAALEACVRKGIGRVIIQSAGFSEVGPAGEALQETCLSIARDFQQMIELTRALAMIPHTPAHCRTAVITFSGGAGILSCDLLEEQGLKIAEFSPETMERLERVFPHWMPVSNPVDLFPAFGTRGPLQAYRETFDAIVGDPAVDAIFMHFIVGFYGQFGSMAELKEAAEQEGKSLVLWVIGRREGARLLRRESEKNGIPAHGEVSRAVECLAAASRYEPRGTRLKAGPG